MSYATTSDALEILGERELIALTDRENQGAVQLPVLQGALTKASAEIDSYMVGRYATPLSPVDDLVKTYCVDIARYRLSGADVTEVETVRNRFKDAIRWLEGVRDGKNKLGAAVAVAGADGTQDLAYAIPSFKDRVFSRGNR